MFAPERIADSNFVPLKLAPWKFALLQSAFSRFAFSRFAFSRFASRRSAYARSASDRLALERFARLRQTCRKYEPLKVSPCEIGTFLEKIHFVFLNNQIRLLEGIL